ncbi:hypothetical protein AX16_005247 [Volvariella volvacea WC 439]|nr:hypothetical protein AX16_005247 [Volvariella volvacea WC 439]
MEEALAKIRSQTSSSLEHQKVPATLLLALETTLKEQNAEQTPTAYFATLMTTLDGTMQRGDVGLEEADILPAELYLLALVAPFVPPPVIRTNLQTMLSLTAGLFSPAQARAPPLRSLLSIYQAIFQALDRSQLDAQGIRQSFATVLQLCIDHRPKVRKKATEVVHQLLRNPSPPLVYHPYADRVADYSIAVLSSVNEGPFAKSKDKGADNFGAEAALHLLSFLRPILLNLPAKKLPPLINLLLPLSHLGNSYLTQFSYNVLSDLFRLQAESSLDGAGERITDILQVVLSAPPAKSDSTISPAWVGVLGSAMQAYKHVDSEECNRSLLRVWKSVWPFLESSDAKTRIAAAESLEKLGTCVAPSHVMPVRGSHVDHSALSKIVRQLLDALGSLAYAHAIPELLVVAAALIKGLRFRENRDAPTAAELFLLPIVEHIGELRIQKGFEHKEVVDETLSVAMQIMGPEVVLRVLPLNLDTMERQAGLEPRAFLLPLLAKPHPSPLSHFVSYFVPLSERMFDAQQKAEADGRASEAKVWEVLITQIWSGLSGYCHGTRDLKQTLTPAFAQVLSQLLYSQPNLRPAVLKALKLLVDSNAALAAKPVPSDDDYITSSEAAANIDFLRTQAESWLAILFNVFSTVGNDNRAVVGNVIAAWISIAGDQEVEKAFTKVLSLFKANLEKSPKSTHSSEDNNTISVAAMTQDILIIALPYLSPSSAEDLFRVCLSRSVLAAKDNGVQKRGYKILAKLVESNKISPDALTILKQLDDLLDGMSPAAKKDRFFLLSALVATIPSTSLHVIPSLIPEAVLGTKEPSEKARVAAFDLVVAMGKKMNEGGIVKKSLVDGMDHDGAEDVSANIVEFMTMVAGGLAGASPHMISATVTALARLVFEFKDIIPDETHGEMIMTMLVFLDSANREIVKSTLGFIKLAVHILRIELLQPHLEQLVLALLKWAHDHKNHFKEKVRYIFERMIRRFGWDAVHACAEGEQAVKFLLNIKKRKDRAKRKKAAAGENPEIHNSRPATGDAFEDVLYGSESEADNDNEEGESVQHNRKRRSMQGVRLRTDDDEPIDLLQGMASRITTFSKVSRRQPGQDATYFKTDEDGGKMIIEEDEEIDNAEEDVEGNAYKEALTSVDGFTRGPNGRIKFNKDTKKRRRELEEEEDVEMEDLTATLPSPKHRKTQPKPGHEFRAKKAGGDIKKGGVDPYAYVTLSQAAKTKGRRNRIGIAGKR